MLLSEIYVRETHSKNVNVLSEYYETLMRGHEDNWTRIASDVHMHNIDASYYEFLEEKSAINIIKQMRNTMNIIRE